MQTHLQYLKTNKHNKYVEGRVAGADGDGERRRRRGQRRSSWDHIGSCEPLCGLGLPLWVRWEVLWSSSGVIVERWGKNRNRKTSYKTTVVWMFVFPKIMWWNLDPQNISISLQGLLGGAYVVRVGFHEWDFSCLVIRICWEPSLPTRGGTRGAGASYTLGRGSSPEPSHDGTSSEDFSGPRTVTHPFLSSISFPGCPYGLKQE